MRSLYKTAGLIACLSLTPDAIAQVVPDEVEMPTVPTVSDLGIDTDFPALPEGLAADMARDGSADAVEGRSITNSAMASASAAYMVGDFTGALIHAERAAGREHDAALDGNLCWQRPGTQTFCRHVYGQWGEPPSLVGKKYGRGARAFQNASAIECSQRSAHGV